MTEAKALKLSRKLNGIARELNDYNETKMAASILAEEEEPDEDGLKPRKVLPCTAIINGYVYNVNCKTGEIIP